MRRALILAAPLALVLGLAACGDDDDDSPDETGPAGTETSTDETILPGGTLLPGGTVLPGGTLPEITLPEITLPENADEFLRDSLADLGLDDTQIDCLVERLDLGSGEAPDVSDMMDLFEECDIDPSDLTPGG